MSKAPRTRHDPDDEPTLPPRRDQGTVVNPNSHRQAGLPPEMRQLVGQTLGGCKLVSVLGHGSMGAVFRGLEVALANREVALKVLLPHFAKEQDFLERFHTEATAAGRLSSDHVVKVYRADRERGFPYLVMELIDGCNLLEQNNGQSPPIAEVVRQLKQACEGLYAAERQGLVHRDIKPANIMLKRTSVGARKQRTRLDVKIVDFGVARDRENPAHTEAGSFVGTQLYASPEQLRCVPIDHHSDMYSLGATFYHLLVGRPAPAGKSSAEIYAWTLNAAKISPQSARPDVPNDLNAIIERMTAHDVSARYASFEDVIEALTLVEERMRQTAPGRVLGSKAVIAMVLASVLAIAAAVWRVVTLPEGVGVSTAEDQAGVLRYLDRIVWQDGTPVGDLAKLQHEIAEGQKKLSSRSISGSEILLPLITSARDDLAVFIEAVVKRRDLREATLEGAPWRQILSDLRNADPTTRIRSEQLEARVDDLIEFGSKLDDICERIRVLATDPDALSKCAGIASDIWDLDREIERTNKSGPRPELTPTRKEIAKQRSALDSFTEKARREANLAQIRERLGQWNKQFSSSHGLELDGLWQAVNKQGEDEIPDVQLRDDFQSLSRNVGEAHRIDARLSEAMRASLDDLDAFADSLSRAWPGDGSPSLREWLNNERAWADRRVTVRLLEWLQTEAGPAPTATLKQLLDDFEKWFDKAPMQEILSKESKERLRALVKTYRDSRLGIGPETETSIPPAPQQDPPSDKWSEAAISLYKAVWPLGYKRPDKMGPPSRVDECVVFRYGDDDVPMVLVVPDNGVEPFLADIAQVTHQRLVKYTTDPKTPGTIAPRYFRKVGDAVPEAAHLVFYVLPSDCQRFAEWTDKSVMTPTQYSCLVRAAGGLETRDLLALAKRNESGERPLPLPWPKARPDLAVLKIGLRELVKEGPAFFLCGRPVHWPEQVRPADLERYFDSLPEKEPVGAGDYWYAGVRLVVPLVRKL